MLNWKTWAVAIVTSLTVAAICHYFGILFQKPPKE